MTAVLINYSFFINQLSNNILRELRNILFYSFNPRNTLINGEKRKLRHTEQSDLPKATKQLNSHEYKLRY